MLGDWGKGRLASAAGTGIALTMLNDRVSARAKQRLVYVVAM